MKFYRETFLSETVTQKLHMMEEHVIKFCQWQNGLGLYGEQGGEGIHPEFSRIQQIYYQMKPETRRLKMMAKEHHLRLLPTVQMLKPVIKKEKLKKFYILYLIFSSSFL